MNGWEANIRVAGSHPNDWGTVEDTTRDHNRTIPVWSAPLKPDLHLSRNPNTNLEDVWHEDHPSHLLI